MHKKGPPSKQFFKLTFCMGQFCFTCYMSLIMKIKSVKQDEITHGFYEIQ